MSELASLCFPMLIHYLAFSVQCTYAHVLNDFDANVKPLRSKMKTDFWNYQALLHIHLLIAALILVQAFA